MKRLQIPVIPARPRTVARTASPVATPGARIASEVRAGGLRLSPHDIPVGFRPFERAN
jgi:hypothetical protein